MLGCYFVSRNLFAVSVKIDCVEREFLLSGNERGSKLEVTSQLVNIACLSGVVSRRLDTAGEVSVLSFKAADIVSLPALDRYGCVLYAFNCGVNVNSVA